MLACSQARWWELMRLLLLRSFVPFPKEPVRLEVRTAYTPRWRKSARVTFCQSLLSWIFNCFVRSFMNEDCIEMSFQLLGVTKVEGFACLVGILRSEVWYLTGMNTRSAKDTQDKLHSTCCSMNNCTCAAVHILRAVIRTCELTNFLLYHWHSAFWQASLGNTVG